MANIVKLNYTANEINERLEKAHDVVQVAGSDSSSAMSQYAVSNTFANALKGKIKSEVVSVTDVSPVPHKVKVKVTCPDGVDPTTLHVHASGSKNLIPFPYDLQSGTHSGVSFTIQEDGGILINGTINNAGGAAWLKFNEDFVMDAASVTSYTKYNIGSHSLRFVSNSSSGRNDIMPDDASVNWYVTGGYLAIKKNGHTYDNEVIYPQIEVGQIQTSYEKGTPRLDVSIDENGYGEFISTSSKLTVWAAEADVSVEVEYIKDINSVLTNMTPNARLEEYGLPILYIDGDTYGMRKERECTLAYKYGDRQGTCTMKWQGSSSLQWAKKNYTIKFDNAFEAKEGWGEQKKYCLKANYVDASHARNIICARIWADFVKTRTVANEKLLSLPNCGAVDGFPIIIVLNGEFHGLYTFNIPKDKWMFGMGEGENEAVLCAEGVNSGYDVTTFKAEAKLDGNDFSVEYAPDENDTDWIKTSINRLINAVRNSNGSDIDTTIAQYLDIDSAIDYYIFFVFILGFDNIHRNYCLSTYDGVKWIFNGYDMDSCLGLSSQGFSKQVSGFYCSFQQGSAISKLFELLRNHKAQAIKDRYNQLRQNGFPLFDDAPLIVGKQFIGDIPKGVYDADYDKWRGIKFTSTNNYTQISEYMQARLKFMDRTIETLTY